MSHLDRANIDTMSAILVLGLLASAAAETLTRCTNIPNGYCISLLRDSCPSDTYVSYSGCAFLEQCCYTPETQPQPTSHSHISPTSSCGVPDYNQDQKIVGGTETVIEKYPWQVSIRFTNQHICGGAIISDRWILTAAHCINEMTQPVYTYQFSIVAGSTNQLVYSYLNHFTADYVIAHPGYTKFVNNDIALIKVSKVIDLTGSQMKAVCLADVGDDFTGQICVAAGWGATAEGDDQPMSTMLREVDLPVVDHSLCTFYNGKVDTDNICAGPRLGGEDTCQGDSGGPLVCQVGGVWKQAGIVSYGFGCAQTNTFGIYTEVSKYRDWIDSVMSGY